MRQNQSWQQQPQHAGNVSVQYVQNQQQNIYMTAQPQPQNNMIPQHDDVQVSSLSGLKQGMSEYFTN